MIPDKIMWLLGYQHLAMLLMQDRKHWLMKVARKKQVQHKTTGELFEGTIENEGMNVKLESAKLKDANVNLKKITFKNDALNQIFTSDYSPLPYCAELNGMMIQRITSINYQSNTSEHRSYKLKFYNCEEIVVPLASASDSSDVYATRWMKATQAELLIPNASNQYTTTIPLEFNDDITNVTYYFPLTEALQPVNLIEERNYMITEAITKDGMIGYPAFWMICDQSKLGPSISIDATMFHLGNIGNESNYMTHVYTCLENIIGIENYQIMVTCIDGMFHNNSSDMHKALSSEIKLMNTIHHQITNVHIIDEENVVKTIYMDENASWQYVDDHTYQIPLSTFADNATSHALIPLLTIQLDESIPFTTITTKDLSFSGIQFHAGNDTSEYGAYPYEFNKWSGIPDRLNKLTDGEVPQYTTVYAIHNTPLYTKELPESRQTAALLLDPGEEHVKEDFNRNQYSFIWAQWPYATTLDKMNRVDAKNFMNVIGIRCIKRSKDLLTTMGITTASGTNTYYCKGYDENDQLLFLGTFDMVDQSDHIVTEESWQEDAGDDLGGLYCIHLIEWYGGDIASDLDVPTVIITYTEQQTMNLEAATWYATDITLKLYDLGKVNDPGRVYILSNDDAAYENNATSLTPKPLRTAARICDIPTSIAQLTNIKNIAPTSVVDQKYVRTELSFTEEDKDRIYNVLPSRWVRPTATDSVGEPIYQRFQEQNEDKFVFQSYDLLNTVDLIHQNDFRYYINLNPKVPIENIEIATIVDSGRGYQYGDMGLLIIGGIPFEYHVTEASNGHVQKVALSQGSENIHDVALSNFDMPSDTHGITNPYGTSPVTGIGEGLKIRLLINGYDALCTTKGEIFEDLFAFVMDKEGICLYEYEIDPKSKMIPKSGQWKRKTIVSPFENSSHYQEKGFVSITDAMLASIIPNLQSLPIATADPNLESTSLQVYHSSSFVNVIDQEKTPVKIPSTATGNDILNENYVDINRFYCDGMKYGIAERYDVQSVIDYLKQHNEIYFDTFIIWEWVDINVKQFKYGHIKRGFNNLMSTDTTSLLPVNQLNTNKFVHSNINTTMVWDVPEVGVMMWRYHPTYTKKETYIIDPETRDLKIEKTDMSWKDIKIYDLSTGTTYGMISEKGYFKYNILSNNIGIYQGESTDSDVFYQQPELHVLANTTTSNIYSDTHAPAPPMGNWQLIFPRIHEYTIKNVVDGRTFTPMQLQLIRGDHLNQVDEVLNEEKHVINHKIIVASDTNDGVILKMYNTESGRWEQI